MVVVWKYKMRHTSSSHVFLCDGGGVQDWPFSREDSIALRRVFDKSVLTRLFLDFQAMFDGVSDPDTDTSESWGNGGKWKGEPASASTLSVCETLQYYI